MQKAGGLCGNQAIGGAEAVDVLQPFGERRLVDERHGGPE